MFFDKVSLVTGGFDPIHSGHIAYFERAKDLSDYLVVGLNTNEWLTRKKGQYFLPWIERAEIIRHLDMVDAVISWDDSDESACGAIAKCLEISEFTNSPEILEGRVKTIHPKIHAGILNKREKKSHLKDLKDNNYENIDLVVVNFYPFEETLKKTKNQKKIIENNNKGGG